MRQLLPANTPSSLRSHRQTTTFLTHSELVVKCKYITGFLWPTLKSIVNLQKHKCRFICIRNT